MQKAVDSQGLMSAAYPKGRIFMKEKICCVSGGINAGLFILNICSTIRQSIQTYTLKSCNVCAWSSTMKTSCTRQYEKLCTSTSWRKGTFSKKHTRQRYWIEADLFNPIQHIDQTLFQVICIVFGFRENMLVWKKGFETSWTFLERNQQATWKITRDETK